MEISLDNIGRRFNREWIFRGISRSFNAENSYAILGPNGSGKSTLLHILAGALTPSEGRISYRLNEKVLDHDKVYQHLTIAAPYLELVEELTLSELIEFHFKFKKMADGHDPRSLIQLIELEKARNKQLKYFSSGMKQRVKLGLAMCTDSAVLILDEPTSNLDKNGIEWYLKMLRDYSAGRLVLIGSNQEHEYSLCNERLLITDYK